MNRRPYQPPLLSSAEMDSRLEDLRASDRKADRDVADEIDAYRKAVRKTA
jgi:hypothetical protein